MKSILCIEDDLICIKTIEAALAGDYKVFNCRNIEDAKKILLTDIHHFDLILLDRSLPDGDGIQLCGFLKENKKLNQIPVIFLSAASTEPDKIVAFYAGADDYVTKPFSLLELKARINVRIKEKNVKLRLGNLELEVESHRVFNTSDKSPQELILTRIEFKILMTLLKNVGNLYTREMLLEKVWGDNTHVADRVIDSHVSHLRKKISETGVQITSLRGEGYKINLTSESKLKQKAG